MGLGFGYSEQDKSNTEKKKAEFLECLKQTCNVSRSCEISGLPRSRAYVLREADPQFALDWDAAKEIGFEAMEDEMHRRAFEGTERVSTSGNVIREYSDTLAIFLSKANRPEKYSDRIRNEITGAGGEPLSLSDEKIALKLDTILKNALNKKREAEGAETESDDLC